MISAPRLPALPKQEIADASGILAEGDCQIQRLYWIAKQLMAQIFDIIGSECSRRLTVGKGLRADY